MTRSSPSLARLSLLCANRVDDGWRGLLEPEVTLESYEQQLACAYGFESSLEAALAYAPRRVALADLRPRAGYLVEDLFTLGWRPAHIAELRQCSIEPFASVDEALGWMFVVERGAQIHEAVVDHLDARLPAALGACRYVRASAAGFDARQAALVAELERSDLACVVDATHAACDCVEAWYRAGLARAA
jgi:heme oxygenase